MTSIRLRAPSPHLPTHYPSRREFVLSFSILDEGHSFLLDNNMAKYLPKVCGRQTVPQVGCLPHMVVARHNRDLRSANALAQSILQQRVANVLIPGCVEQGCCCQDD